MDGKIDKKHVDMINRFKMSLPGIYFKKECVTFAKIAFYLKSNHKKGQTMIEKNPSWNRMHNNLI